MKNLSWCSGTQTHRHTQAILRKTYVHVFFGIAQGREGDVAASVEQVGEAMVRLARVPTAAEAEPCKVAAAVAAAAAAAVAAAFVVSVAVVDDGAVAVGGGVVAAAGVGRNAVVAVAVPVFAGLPKMKEERTFCQSLSDKHPVTFQSFVLCSSAQLLNDDVPGGGPGFGTASGGGGGGRLRKFPCCFFGAGGWRCPPPPYWWWWMGGGGGGGALRELGGGDLWCGSGGGYLKVHAVQYLHFRKGLHETTSLCSHFTFALGADAHVDSAGRNREAAG